MMSDESFNEQALLAVAMSAHDNDMDEEALLQNQLAMMQSSEEISKDLVSLGFSEEQVKNALEITDGIKEDAMNYLLVSQSDEQPNADGDKQVVDTEASSLV